MVVDCVVNNMVDDVDVVTLDVQTMHKLVEFATSTATRRRPAPFMDARSSPPKWACARGMVAQTSLSVFSYNGCSHPVHSRNMCYFHVRMDGKVGVLLDIDVILENVFEFVGMNNWEELLKVATVCKSWRRIASPQLSHIGLVPMNGGADRKLNVPDFLAYLTRPVFQNAECIYILCKKADRLYVNDIRQVCPSVRRIFHDKWLMITGIEEVVAEGSGCHNLYRVYKHDHEYTDGVNVWVRYVWDNTYNLVLESSFVRFDEPTRGSRRTTAFLRY